MTKISTGLEDEAPEPEFKPLTPQEAQVWRLKNPATSPWVILWVQVAVSVVLALVVGAWGNQPAWMWSVAWGGFAVVLPAALFARALSRQMKLGSSNVALAGLFMWELVKVVLTVVLLAAAPKVISELSWLALLAGFVVTMKVYWLAWYWSAIRSRSV
nr:ATP synthase subunit I [uncultured Limnohabitans sp.]